MHNVEGGRDLAWRAHRLNLACEKLLVLTFVVVLTCVIMSVPGVGHVCTYMYTCKKMG